MFGGVFIDTLLCGVLIIDMIEGESLPYTQMRVGVHVSLSLLLTHFCTQVFHDGARLVVRGDTHDAPELTILSLLTGQRGSHSYHDFKIVISTT